MAERLAKIRSAPSRAWHATGRTLRWAGGGVGSGWRRATGGVRGAADNARSSPRTAITWAAGGLVLLAWIGWAIYVTAEHGGEAGLGVVISWPAAIAAVALIAAPFVGIWLLVRRLMPRDGGPPIAGGAPDGSGGDELTGGTYPG